MLIKCHPECTGLCLITHVNSGSFASFSILVHSSFVISIHFREPYTYAFNAYLTDKERNDDGE